MSPVPAGLIAERHIIERLLRANAVSASAAQPLELSRRIERRRLVRLVARGVVREAPSNQYYLDAPSLADYQSRLRAARAVALIGIIVLMALALAFATMARPG